MRQLSRFFIPVVLILILFSTSCGPTGGDGSEEAALLYRKARDLYNLKENYRENRLKAFDEFKKVVDIYPDSHLAPEALYYLIKISEKYRTPRDTLSLSRRMMNEFPDNNHQAEVKAKLAGLLWREGTENIRTFLQARDTASMDTGMNKLREAIELKPGHQGAKDTLRKAYTIAGEWYETKKEIKPAIKNFEQAMADDPDWGYGHFKLAGLYEKDGQTENAVRHYEKASESYKEAFVYHPLGRLYLAAENLPKAAEAFEKCVEVSPHNEDAYRDLAQTYGRSGNQEKSRKALDQADHIKKWGYADRGKHEKDIEGWMNAIGTDPQPVFYYNLAALYDSQEDKKNAFQYFNIYRGRAKNEAFKEAEKRYVNKIKRRMGVLKRELGIKAHTKLE